MVVCVWNRWRPSPRFFGNTASQFERNFWGRSYLPFRRSCWDQPIPMCTPSCGTPPGWPMLRPIPLRPLQGTSLRWLQRPRAAAILQCGRATLQRLRAGILPQGRVALRRLRAAASHRLAELPPLQAAILPLGQREDGRDIAVIPSLSTGSAIRWRARGGTPW